MTKEITKARIIQEIADKFQLRELEPEKFSFLESVRPTYDIGQHLTKWVTKYIELPITSGPAGYSFFTIPPNERWTVRGYNVVFMAAGAYTVTGVYVRRATADDIIYLDMKEGQTVSYAVNLPVPVVVNPNEYIKIYVDAYISTASLRLYIDYKIEEIR